MKYTKSTTIMTKPLYAVLYIDKASEEESYGN